MEAFVSADRHAIGKAIRAWQKSRRASTDLYKENEA
jgi:tRNA threonylcarbamoyladenosine modification (KEOPS) complex Cgi121 subunit